MQLNELKKHMKGIAAMQMTPFNKDGSLDLEGMRANTRWLVERTRGKDIFFVPLGSSGEFASMSDEERKAVIKMVVEETKGKAVTMPGCAQPGTLETVKMCQYAQSVGADGAMIVLPYYHIPEEEGMYLHYKTIAESVDSNFGIIIYNNPGVSFSWIKPSLMKRISKIPNIIAVKENTMSFSDYYEVKRAVDPEDTAILCGTGDLMFTFGALHGCPCGLFTPMANWAPELAYSLYEAAVARDFGKLIEIFNSSEPLRSFGERVNQKHGPDTAIPYAWDAAGGMFASIQKAAMDIIGLRGGEVRLPLIGLNDEEKAELGSVLRAMKIVK